MVKRMVAAAAVALGLLAVPAGAQQYPPAVNSLTVSDTTPTPGQTIDITAQTFVGGSSVTVTLNPETVLLGTATSDPSGVARLAGTIPASTPLGAHAHGQHHRGGGRRVGRLGHRWGPAPHR
jgi:hypothetical protein